MRHPYHHADYPQPDRCSECKAIAEYVDAVRHALEAFDDEERQRVLDLQLLGDFLLSEPGEDP